MELVHTMQSNVGSDGKTLDRRAFLRGTGAIVVAFNVSGGSSSGLAQGAQTPAEISPKEVDSWIKIDGAGRVTLFSGKVELGQGINTAFAQIAAEELDVPLASVTLIQGDTQRTPDQGVSSRSQSISVGGVQVRQAAAEARQALLELASRRLDVPVEQLKVTDGVVSGGTSRVSYGELIGDQKFSRRVSGKAPTKRPSDYKIVGTPAQRVDIPDKVTGRFAYVQDVRVPGMLHARVIRPPAIGATLIRVDGFSKSRPEVRVVAKKNFLAVVALSEWGTIEAAADLKAQWSPGSRLPPASDLAATLRGMPSADAVVKSVGKLDDGFQSAAKTLTASYLWPFQSHGSIGPSCAVADVRGDGTATIWSSTQDVYMQREAVARLLKIPKESVHIIYVEGSGCYGHNGADDANGDAALLSQEMGRPVRVQHSRYDEHAWAPRGAPYLVDLRAGLSVQGEVTAWDFQSWALTHSCRYRHYENRPSGYLLATQLSGGEVDVPCIAEPGKIINAGAISGTTPTYAFPNLRTLIHGLPTAEPHPLRPTEFRSVAALGAVFAVESFVDELAAASGRDPVAFRLAHLRDARSIEVLKSAAALAQWQTRPSPKQRDRSTTVVTGRGIAMAFNNTYVAAVADVAVDVTSGSIRVQRLCLAHDCGLVINPDGVRNQIEGNLVQATSRSLLEEVKWDGSRVTSVDWRSYPILRFPDVPELSISLISRPDVPSTGAGEPATMPVAAAIANAVFDAVGARLRQGPFTPERLIAAMGR
jgi:nicotinate dehydrogenase subunit B